MFVEERCHYSVLTHVDQETRPRYVDKKLAFIMVLLTFPVILFCISYMSVFGIKPNIVYPKAVSQEVPGKNLHRATLYSSVSSKISNTQNLPTIKKHSSASENAYKLVCYYDLPSSASSLQVDDLDASICTHIIAAFARVVNNTLHLQATQQANLKKLVHLKSANKDLKILVSVGGAGNDVGFPEMVINHTNRKSFIKSALDYVKSFKIDGIDLDWEFPNEQNGNDKYQKMHFTQLLEEFRHSINRIPNCKFLLSVAVAAPDFIMENSYDISYMNDYVDFINLMTYDYHFYTKETPFTGINSPLYPSDSEKYYLATLNINHSAHNWHYMGMDQDKIIIGLPTYGHSFRLANPKNNGTYAPAFGYGKLGDQGFVQYSQVCAFLIANQISPVFDMDTKSPYASKLYEWVSFDNEQSLTFKAEYVKNNNFGGAMVYSLNADDYAGNCGGQSRTVNRFPLIRSIKDVLS